MVSQPRAPPSAPLGQFDNSRAATAKRSAPSIASSRLRARRSIRQASARLRSGAAQAPERGRMDLRTYGIGAQILRECGVHKMRLMGNPRRMPSMTG